MALTCPRAEGVEEFLDGEDGILVFTAFIRLNGNSRAPAEMAQAQATLLAVDLFATDGLSAGAVVLLFVLTLAFAAGVVLLKRRTDVTMGQMVGWLLALAVLTTVGAHVAGNTVTASLDLAVKLTLLVTLLAWAALAAGARVRRRAVV